MILAGKKCNVCHVSSHQPLGCQLNLCCTFKAKLRRFSAHTIYVWTGWKLFEHRLRDRNTSKTIGCNSRRDRQHRARAYIKLVHLECPQRYLLRPGLSGRYDTQTGWDNCIFYHVYVSWRYDTNILDGNSIGVKGKRLWFDTHKWVLQAHPEHRLQPYHGIHRSAGQEARLFSDTSFLSKAWV